MPFSIDLVIPNEVPLTLAVDRRLSKYDGGTADEHESRDAHDGKSKQWKVSCRELAKEQG